MQSPFKALTGRPDVSKKMPADYSAGIITSLIFSFG